MTLEVFTPYLTDGKTHVVVRDTDPDLNVNFTAVLDGDFMNKSKAELLQLGLSWFTGKYVQEYANQKTVEAVAEVKDKIAQIDDAIERSDKQYERVEELLKVTTGTVNELITSLMTEEEEAVTDEPETEIN
ncbi:Protein of uncharacterised function (DUF1366) [Streptococcus acidominimus]|uniref:Protein of uncharacterized function (DUF1366) n=1 Tax=Streptococcus acidominimus TaxID=1326 RepID=A0A239WZP3_STRAI|nr:DUF1366 domain-containing protein [Streptococcus acidominimus]SNV39961.1 Protein of uncharacterised function (DUF1366) [Streptococcus acidominimus]